MPVYDGMLFTVTALLGQLKSACFYNILVISDSTKILESSAIDLDILMDFRMKGQTGWHMTLHL
jgi:hypothetical protein